LRYLESTLIEQHREKTDKLSFFFKIKIERYAKLKKYTKKLMKGLAKLTKVLSHFKRPKYFAKYFNQDIERKNQWYNRLQRNML